MAGILTDKFTDRNTSVIAEKLVNMLRRKFKRFGNQGQALSIFPIVGRGDDSLDASYRLACSYDNFKDYHHSLNARQDEDGPIYVRTRPNRFKRRGVIIPDLTGKEKPGSPQAIYGKEELIGLTTEVLIKIAAALEHHPGLILPGRSPSLIKPETATGLLVDQLETTLHRDTGVKNGLRNCLKVLDTISHQIEFAIIISDFLSSDWEDWLIQTSRRVEVVAFQVTDPWDIELPEFGQRFSYQDQVIRINARNPKVRQTYNGLTQKQQDHIKTLLARQQVQHHRLSTTTPLLGQLERSLDTQI